MAKKQIVGMAIDFDTRYETSVGYICFFRLDGEEIVLKSRKIQPRTVGRVLEAQRLMLAKIEKVRK